MKNCIYCGQQLNSEDLFCKGCGKQQTNVKEIQKEENLKYANFGKRFAAFLLDSLVGVGIGFLWFFLSVIVFTVIKVCIIAYEVEMNHTLTMISSFIEFFPSILLIIYGQPIISFFGDKSKKKHASIGKRVMKIRIVNENGTDVTTGQLFLRLIIKLFIPYSMIISLITILATKKKQALQDMILKEIVVEE